MNDVKYDKESGCGRRLAALLLVVFAFLSIQTLAQLHIHIDEEPETTCTTCCHVQSAAVQPSITLPEHIVSRPAREPSPNLSPDLAPVVDYDHLSRAPPVSR